MITIRPADQRGRADFGWLQSRHSFSFGHYYDEQHMGFSALRVINDDHVAPGKGFETHGHRDMEIISYVLEGEIAHRDSEGNVAILPAGEFQLMSAGSGIRHSEFNPSKQNPLRFLQIWIVPDVYGQTPGYQQKDFGKQAGLTLIASADGEQGSLTIKQDARLYQLVLDAQGNAELNVEPTRHYYVHVFEGELRIAGQLIKAGDAAKLESIEQLVLATEQSPAKALVFDLP